MRRGGAGLLAGLCLCLGGCGSSVVTAAPNHTRPAVAAVTVAQPPRPTTGPVARPAIRRDRRRRRTNPGTLPQTSQLPSARTRAFVREMRGLWRAVVAGTLAPGLQAFFPEPAYVQVKAIGDPQGDWQDRLVADYRLDIEAAHALLGRRPRAARLLAVDVPAAYAHYVDPARRRRGRRRRSRRRPRDVGAVIDLLTGGRRPTRRAAVSTYGYA